MKPLTRQIAPLVLVLITALSTCAEDAVGLLFLGDFEDGSMDAYRDSNEHTVAKVAIVTDPVRAGHKALEVTLDREQHRAIGNHRTDFWLYGMGGRFLLEHEYWYGFSTYLPTTWEPDSQAELIVQWVPGRGATRTTGGPCLAIYVYGPQYCVRKRWGAGPQDYKNIWRGDVLQDRGKWIDWVFRVRWSPEETGEIEVWRDGEHTVMNRGLNCGPADFAPYFKFGIYKWPWKSDDVVSNVTRRVMYFDEIRIADSGGSLQMVSPPAEN